MQTIVVMSQKGGSGKTTLAIHLAAEAAATRRALLLDLDPQASAALWGDRRGELPPDVVAEHPARLEASLQAARRDGYDLVVVDTAPHADQAALKAARLADLVLVPCRPATFDLAALQATLEICDLARRRPLVVVNAAPVRSRVVAEAEAEIARLGAAVAAQVIHQRVAFQHCLIDGRTAGSYEPDGAAAAEISALFADVCLYVGREVSMSA